MELQYLTNAEISLRLARAIHIWRVSPEGAGISQADLARKAGIGLTPLKRFEKTGAITLRNLVAILRALDLLDGLDTLVPEPGTPGPLALLDAERTKRQRVRAPRATAKRTSAGKDDRRG
jgi:hypothetical protein